MRGACSVQTPGFERSEHAPRITHHASRPAPFCFCTPCDASFPPCPNCPKSKCWSVIWGRCWRPDHSCCPRASGEGGWRLRPRANSRKRLRGAKFCGLARRGKYLLFELRQARTSRAADAGGPPGHDGADVSVAGQGPVCPSTRRWCWTWAGRTSFSRTRATSGGSRLDASALARLGPEPLGAEFTAKRFARGAGPFAAADQGQAARPIAAGGRGEHLRQRGVVPGGHCADAAGAEIDGGTGQAALARHSRGAPGGHRLRQHRPAELRRPGEARWAVLLRPGARRAGLLRGAAAGLRSSGPAVPGVRDGDQATGAGGPEHVLLPAVPARAANPKAEAEIRRRPKPEIRGRFDPMALVCWGAHSDGRTSERRLPQPLASHLGLRHAVGCGNWRVGAREVMLPAAARVTHRTTHYEGSNTGCN